MSAPFKSNGADRSALVRVFRKVRPTAGPSAKLFTNFPTEPISFGIRTAVRVWRAIGITFKAYSSTSYYPICRISTKEKITRSNIFSLPRLDNVELR